MKFFKNKIITILLLLVMAVIGIYIADAGISCARVSNDTKSGHYPCNKPATSRDLCKKKGINCKAWLIYDACVDGSAYCE